MASETENSNVSLVAVEALEDLLSQNARGEAVETVIQQLLDQIEHRGCQSTNDAGAYLSLARLLCSKTPDVLATKACELITQALGYLQVAAATPGEHVVLH